MATIDELRQIRLKKLVNIQHAGMAAYPIASKRTQTIKDVLSDWDKLFAKASLVTIAGRIRSARAHGALTFIDVEDASGKIQVLLRQDGLGEKSYEFFGANFDVGDFVEVRGDLFIAKRGEKTINAADYKMLAKSLRPLPEKWHGLQDVEERYRKRYLDLIFNDDVRKKFAARTEIIKTIRNFWINKVLWRWKRRFCRLYTAAPLLNHSKRILMLLIWMFICGLRQKFI